MWFVGSIIKVIFPRDFLITIKLAHNPINFIIVLSAAIIISIILDLLILSIRKGHLKPIFKKTIEKLTPDFLIKTKKRCQVSTLGTKQNSL